MLANNVLVIKACIFLCWQVSLAVLLVYLRNFFVISTLQIVSKETQSLLLILAEHDVIIKPKQKYCISLMTTILTFFRLPMIVKEKWNSYDMWLLASCNQSMHTGIFHYHFPVLGHDIWKIRKIIFKWHNVDIIFKIRKWITFTCLICDDEICFDFVAV